MNRRKFLSNCTAITLWSGARLWCHAPPMDVADAPLAVLDESVVGQPVDLARYAEAKSWLSPEAAPHLQAAWQGMPVTPLKLATLPWKDNEFDVGVEWPEFRTIDKVVIRFAGEDKAPRPERQFLEYWSGLSALQGSWRALEYWLDRAADVQIDKSTWTYTFVPPYLPFRMGPIRTCKTRLRLQDQKHVEIKSFEVYGPSKWKSGAVYVEWGHLEGERLYDGSLESYNGEVLEVRPLGSTQPQGPLAWTSTASPGRLSGIVAKVLYTSGLAVDRTVLTLRTKSWAFSFLPGEAIEKQPIDIPDFGVYVRNDQSSLDRPAYRRQNQGKSRILDAVSKHPEQNLEDAYQHIQPPRTRLSFVGVDSNYQKFGIRPEGHVVVGNTDPRFGKVVRPPSFAIHFATSGKPNPFVPGADEKGAQSEVPKDQSLEEGWLPILVTRWTEDLLAFERTDYASLLTMPDPLDESRLTGTEPAVMISRLQIRNDSPVTQTAQYYIRPWKPPTPTPEGIELIIDSWLTMKNGFQTGLWESCVIAKEDDAEWVICAVDTHGRGTLSADPRINAVRYIVELNAGEAHTIHTVIPGWPLPAAELSRLKGLAYDQLHDSAVKYWKNRLAEGLQVEIPDPHLQNLYKASLHHFLLALTKDAKRDEYYAHVGMFIYGAVGSESSPIIQALDMRGMHARAAGCLKAFLSTQGQFLCDGDFISKEGSLCRFWPTYSNNQGPVLGALAEHYLYSRDKDWLREVAPQIVAGCNFVIRERQRTMKELPGGGRPLSYGLAPAGTETDPRDWQYSFMLNGYFYLGLKKSAQVLQDVDPENAKRIAAEAEDYSEAIQRALRESITISPVTRLRDNTSVPSVPSYLGLRGFRSEVDGASPESRPKDNVFYDVELGALHLLKSEILEPADQEVTWILNYLEDRFFLTQPETTHLNNLGQDWFNLGGFPRGQPYYSHHQDAYLQRDQIPNFLRSFFNTLASSADPQTLTFMEGAFGGGAPHKTHEEAWFFHQLRFMLVMEMGQDLYLARGTPRRWLEDGKNIVVSRAPSYFGELAYQIRSFVNQGRIEATVNPPVRSRPASLYLRLRHPQQASLKRVMVNGRPWKDFDAGKEWIKLPTEPSEIKVVAYY